MRHFTRSLKKDIRLVVDPTHILLIVANVFEKRTIAKGFRASKRNVRCLYDLLLSYVIFLGDIVINSSLSCVTL